MNYSQYVTAIEWEVRERMKSLAEVSVQQAMKNNGVVKQGIMIMEHGVNIAPTIYLEEFYGQYCKGRTVEQTADAILEMYREVRFEHSYSNVELQDYESLRGKILFRLVNREKNEAFLNTVPYLRWLDLAIIFYVNVDLRNTGSAAMTISREQSDSWAVSAEELFEQASLCTPRLLPAQLRAMSEVIGEMIEQESYVTEAEEVMYVLTNTGRSYGAACILYDLIPDMIYDKFQEDFYLLPSSIHEMIIVPESKAPSASDLNEMIREINETQVTAEEILADHAYIYRSGKRQFQIPKTDFIFTSC